MFNNTCIGRSTCSLFVFAVLSGCQPKVDVEQRLRKAAEQGNAVAQHEIGNRYYFGHGVPMDQRAAVKWYRRAAVQGHAAAQCDMGLAYGDGEGVTQDFTKAYAWFHLAAIQGDERAVEYKGRYAKAMSREQLAEAKKLASRLREQIDAGQLSAEVEDTNGGKAPPSVPHGKHIVETRSAERVSEYSGEYFVMGFRKDRILLPNRAMRLTFDPTTGAVVGQWDVKYKDVNPGDEGSQFPVGSGEIAGDFNEQSGTLRLQLAGTTIFSGERRPPNNRMKEKVFRGRLSGGVRGKADSLILIQK